MNKQPETESTKKIAKFVVETKTKNVPKEAIEYSKKALLDYFGVQIAGASEASSRIMFNYVKSQEAKKEAGVVLQGFKTSAELAALANGTVGHALDFDDTIPASVHYNLHPSVSILPAVIALGEKYDFSWSKVMASYVVGLEVQYRVGLAIGLHVQPNGWHSTPILGTIGAAAGCANLLELDMQQTIMALGISGSLTGGMVRNLDTMVKPMHAGNAARAGVISSELAKGGYGSNQTILDGDFNFFQMFSGYKVKELGNLADDLSKKWNILSIGILFKPWPCCRATHGSIEAALYLRNHNKIDPEQIEKITCKTHPVIPIFASRHQPVSGYEGKFSVEYCLATALITGQISLADFTDEKVKDPLRQLVGSKLTFVHPQGWGIGTVDPKVEVTIRMKNGQEFVHLVTLPKGEPENPLTDDEMIGKFKDCTKNVFKNKEAERVIDNIMHLEKLSKISQLTDLITGK
jgi:2-methylcitrate dehydratase PrpD